MPVTVIKPTSVVKGPAKAPGQVQASAPAAPSDSVKVPGMPGSIYDTEQAAYGLDATGKLEKFLPHFRCIVWVSSYVSLMR